MPIRQPSSEGRLYSHWRRAVAGYRVEIHEDDPRCGFYVMRRKKGAPWVAVHIYMRQEICPETGELTEPEKLEAIANGHIIDPLKIWTYCRPISAEAYDAQTGIRGSIPDMIDPDTPIQLDRIAAIRP